MGSAPQRPSTAGSPLRGRPGFGGSSARRRTRHDRRRRDTWPAERRTLHWRWGQRTLRTSLTVATIAQTVDFPSPARVDASTPPGPTNWRPIPRGGASANSSPSVSFGGSKLSQPCPPVGVRRPDRCGLPSSTPTCWCSDPRRAASWARSWWPHCGTGCCTLPGAGGDRAARVSQSQERDADADHLRGYPGTPESVDRVRRVAELATRAGGAAAGDHLRGTRPHHVPAGGRPARRGLSILGCLGRPRRPRCWPRLRTDGIVGEDVVLQVVSGNGWDQAPDDAEWQDGEIPALGTPPRGDIAGFPSAHGAPRSCG